MRIAIKGRNTPVTDDIRDYVERRFGKIAKQVSPLAELEVEVREERNPAIADSQVAEVTLHLKGVTPPGPRRIAGHDPLDQPLRGGAGPPGQAPS